MSRPRLRPGLASCDASWRGCSERAAGKAGRPSRFSNSTAAHNAAMAPKAARQPASSPRKAPSGTPSTDATATPPKMMDVASPTALGPTSLLASPPAIAQTPPMQKPTNTRAARNHGMLGAHALAALAQTNSASKPQRMTRRSAPLAPRTTSGAHSAARIAGTNSMKPPIPTDTSSAPVMGTNSPTGSISVVTTQKVAMPTAMTPSHARQAAGWLLEESGMALSGAGQLRVIV